MLHIIGLDHRAQSRTLNDEESEAQQAFSRILKEAIQDVHPVLIAEEESEENLVKQKKISIAKGIADSAGIEHRFCDPGQVERQSMGYLKGEDILSQRRDLLGRNLPFEECSLRAHAIEMGQHFPKRERFWLRGLNECRELNAVFICGDSHIDSFTSLLGSEGIPHKVLERGIGMTEVDHGNVHRIVQLCLRKPTFLNR